MTRQWFRNLIVLWWFLIVVTLLVQMKEDAALPQAASDLLDANAEATMTPINAAVSFFSAGMLLIASIGLSLFRKWGRSLFVVGTVLSLTLSPLYGTMVSTPWAGTLSMFELLLNGGLLFMIYLPPVSQMFEPADGVPDEDEAVAG